MTAMARHVPLVLAVLTAIFLVAPMAIVVPMSFSKATSFDEVEVDEDGVTTVTRVVVTDGTDPVTGLALDAADAEDAVAGVPASDFTQGAGTQ